MTADKNKWWLALAGAAAGFVNGFLGGGGGVVVVMSLLALAGFKQKNAQATALLIILPLTIVSAVVYLIKGAVDWNVTLYASIGVFVGGVAGALLLNKIKGNAAKIIFALVLIAGGVRMVLGRQTKRAKKAAICNEILHT